MEDNIEIRYTNSEKDIEFLVKYTLYRTGYITYKYLISFIFIISGIYYSLKYNSTNPFFYGFNNYSTYSIFSVKV